MRRLALAALVVWSALALAACARAPEAPSRDVRVVIYSEPTSLSLIGNTDMNSSQIASLISDGLVAYDAKARCVPMVARSWEMAPDGRTLTFRLREGVKWHDGAPVTSKDVAYTVEKIKDPTTQSRSWASQFSNVASVETPDDLTLIVRYDPPYADAVDAWRVPLVPRHVAGRDSDFLNGAFAQHPIGCGPFRYVSRAPGQNIVLAANPGYWGGRPAIDRMIVRIASSDRTAYEALVLGDVDVLGVTPDLWREAETSPAAARFGRFVYYRLTGWKVDWNLDGSNPFFSDPRVRRALVLALDRERFSASVAAGLARPAVGSYPPESPWSDPSLAPLPFDRDECARLLDAAGWRFPPGRRVREKGGRPLAFTLLLTAGSQEIADRIAAWMQESLAAVGVDMSIEKLEFRALQERRRQHRFEAVMATNTFDPTPDQFELYHSSARAEGLNYGGFADGEIDQLLEQGRATLDPGARHEIYNRLQARLQTLQPISYLFQFAQPVLHDARLEGIAASPVGLFQFSPGPRAWRWAGTGP